MCDYSFRSATSKSGRLGFENQNNCICREQVFGETAAACTASVTLSYVRTTCFGHEFYIPIESQRRDKFSSCSTKVVFSSKLDSLSGWDTTLWLTFESWSAILFKNDDSLFSYGRSPRLIFATG